ncbi:SirB1 family protein [Anaeromyxobacter oryzisoli]|uniref:SirB1 family protein n=1 Tax=Anaeromyxobacter oryzisoli TaxID=2925408 RepID=UPI001F599994|nr:transglutaminase-like domain-containing protein [Anaeromyxobacter sp. SG63]
MSDDLESPARARFAALLQRDPIPLDAAALAIAQEEYPHLDAGAYLARLDALGARVARAGGTGRAASLLRALRAVLHDEEGLRGNEEDYSDPRNSYLNDVLDRRLGIPISLSAIYIEVARRAGLTLAGVGFPGHFLAKYVSASGVEVFVDAFRGGEMLSADECVARYRARTSGQVLDARHLEAVSTRQILARMLQNLRLVHQERRDDVRAYWVLDRLLLVAPGQLEALRDRGRAAARLGGPAAAARDLAAYLKAAPGAADAADIRAELSHLAGGRKPLLN